MIGKRIKQFRKHNRLTLVQLSETIGITPSSLSDIENGKTKPSSDTIESLVRNTTLNPLWLITGESHMTEDDMDGMVNVEVLAYTGLGRFQRVADQAPLEKIPLPRKLVTRKGKTISRAVLCRGDGMYPTIVDGGLVGIDFEDREPVENAIYLFRFPDVGLAIKRLRIKIDGCLAVADNKTVEDQMIPADYIEQGVIVARARWVLNGI